MKRKLIISFCMSLAMLLAPTLALAQSQKVKGTVLDENGEPIIGATIKVAGQTAGGTVTDYCGSAEFTQGNSVVATNGIIQQDLLNAIL